LLTSTLEIALNNTLHKLIGRKSVKDIRAYTLGIDIMRVSARHKSVSPIEKVVATIVHTLVATTS